MAERTIPDRLREEYFDLRPDIQRVALRLEGDIRHCILPVLNRLKSYEQVIVKSRIKECESAIATLRRKQEGNVFDPDKTEKYSLLNLNDLAGLRVLVFPCERLLEIDQLLHLSPPFDAWTSDPLRYARGFAEAPKYHGVFKDVSEQVRSEYQVVPMLIGNFWEVEHSALYKPTGWAKGADNNHALKTLRTKVEISLVRFEEQFENFVKKNSQGL
jgi:hypothetical protein